MTSLGSVLNLASKTIKWLFTFCSFAVTSLLTHKELNRKLFLSEAKNPSAFQKSVFVCVSVGDGELTAYFMQFLNELVVFFF